MDTREIVTPFYPLTTSTWGREERDAIARVTASGRITMGDEVKAFEHEFAKHHGRKHGIMVNSGSSANLIATACLCFKKNDPLHRGDEAIVPAIAWGTTYHPLYQYGLKMRVVDVDLDTLNVDISRLEQALTPQSRLLVAVSILGNPAALDLMLSFANRYNLYLLEDNCESLDAEVGGRKTGTYGNLSTFSFFYSHHISTGEGGMILTNNDELANLARCLRAHGWTRDLKIKSPPELYHFILPGYNVRPLEIQGAVGREQLKKLSAMIQQRRKNLVFFRSLFKNDKWITIPLGGFGKNSSFGFPLIIRPQSRLSRSKVFFALTEAGIEHRMITGGNILCHSVCKYYDIKVATASTPTLINAGTVHAFGFFVGNYPIDLTLQIERLRLVMDQLCGEVT